MKCNEQQFAEELFNWIAPYSGSVSGIGLMASNQITAIVNELILKYEFDLKNEGRDFLKLVLVHCNVWSKVSDNPYTEKQKQSFIETIVQFIQVEQN